MIDGSESEFRLAATGDAMITRELAPPPGRGPEFDALTDVLSDATATVSNLEMVLHEFEADDGVYAHNSGGTYMRAPPTVLDELTALGCDAYTAAQNHAFDYAYGGMLSTMAALDARELPFAGLGRNRYEARRPAYFETPAGRVAVLSATSRFSPGAAATQQTDALYGSPGVNPLGTSTVYRVTDAHVEQLRQTSRLLNIEDIKRTWIERGHYSGRDWLDEDYFHFLDMKFETVTDEDDCGIYYEANTGDVTEICEWIREANRSADWVVMGIHTHASALGYFNQQTTPDFLQDVARTFLDAGADTVVGTGPHKLRGIELYDERPIFYSLGNFIDQREYISRFPPDMYDRYDIDDYTKPRNVFEARWTDEEGNRSGDLVDRHWWESVVPVCTFDTDGDLDRIELHPISLNRDAGRPARGTPTLAADDHAADVLDIVTALSEPFGTTIEREDGVGVIRP
jgi:poly-gamma-glutamate synthesis protein (capsule biosynthesis protein)